MSRLFLAAVSKSNKNHKRGNRLLAMALRYFPFDSSHIKQLDTITKSVPRMDWDNVAVYAVWYE